MKKLFLLLFTIVHIFASEVITLKSNIEKIDNFKIFYHKDINNDIDFKQIQTISMNETIPNRFSLGYLDHSVWFKIEVFNDSSNKESYILAFEEPFLHSVSLHYNKDGVVQAFSNSITQDMEDRSIPNPNNHFRIYFEPYEKIDLYIKVRSKFSTFSEVFFYSEQYYAFDAKKDYFIYLIYLGAIGVIAFYNLVLYLYLRESTYLFYFGYTFSFGFWMALFSGLAYAYIPSKYGYYLHFFTPLAIIFLTLFSNKVLELKKNYPFIYKITVINLYFNLILVIWIPLELFSGFQLVSVVASYTFSLYFVISLLRTLKGDIIARFYFIAIGIFLISISLLSLMSLGIIPNTLVTRYLFIAGSFIEIVMFSLLLAFRIDITQKTYQAELENEVAQKTESISKQNIQLQELLQEKEILVKEIFHRVKNNFQILIAHLSVESFSEKNPLIKNNTLRIISKIKSLSIVNDMLYSQKEKELINIKEYFEVFFSHSIDKTAKVELDVDSMHLGASLVKKLGLLVNEMITNTLKHNQETKNLTIYFSCYRLQNKMLRLEYHDSQKKSKKSNSKQGYGTVFIKDFTNSLKNCKIEKGENNFHYIITFEV